MTRFAMLLVLALAAVPVTGEERPDLLSAADVMDFEQPAADARIKYGKRRLQFGELRVPRGMGPHPVAIFIHGGCWLAQYDIAHTGRLTAALAANGIATWSLEYRRVGNGGEWPRMFRDVATGVDHLRRLAPEHDLDLERVILMGHSAGGHLALWAAARTRLPKENSIGSYDPLLVRGVLALAPAPGLTALHERQVCGHVIDKLMGGSPQRRSERYDLVDLERIAPTVPQVLLVGRFDNGWAWSGRSYFDIAKARGDDVRLIEAKEAGHFEVIDPDSSTWPLVLGEARALLGGS